MPDNKVQISARFDDGTIVVVGGADTNEFFKNLQELGVDPAAVLPNFKNFESMGANKSAPWDVATANTQYAQQQLASGAGGQEVPPGADWTAWNQQGHQQPPQGQFVPQGPPQGQGGAPQQGYAPAQPPGGAPVCRHGARVWKEGIAKQTGKPYRLWSCTVQSRQDQCPAEYVN